MKKTLTTLAMLAVLPGIALAAGEHEGGHGHDNSDGHHAMMSVGEPGKASDVTKTIDVVMKETDDGEMIFEPKKISVMAGETVRFMVMNKGELEHEFVLDDHNGVMEHKALMEKFPEMEHDDPNSVRLDPGLEGEVIWKFNNSGAFEFACLIPGHYDSGMKGVLNVGN